MVWWDNKWKRNPYNRYRYRNHLGGGYMIRVFDVGDGTILTSCYYSVGGWARSPHFREVATRQRLLNRRILRHFEEMIRHEQRLAARRQKRRAASLVGQD